MKMNVWIQTFAFCLWSNVYGHFSLGYYCNSDSYTGHNNMDGTLKKEYCIVLWVVSSCLFFIVCSKCRLIFKILKLFSFLPSLKFVLTYVIIQELVIMSGLQTQDFPSAIRLTKAPKDQGPTVMADSESKPKKKICCACPDTKKLRDECIVEHGETACSKWIEAHRQCLRSEGFNVWLLKAAISIRRRIFSFLPSSFRDLHELDYSSCESRINEFWLIILLSYRGRSSFGFLLES